MVNRQQLCSGRQRCSGPTRPHQDIADPASLASETRHTKQNMTAVVTGFGRPGGGIIFRYGTSMSDVELHGEALALVLVVQ